MGSLACAQIVAGSASCAHILLPSLSRQTARTLHRKFHPILMLVFSASLFGLGPMAGQAQLVADGATNTINGYSTNLVGDLIVGTNSSFTRLEIINGGIVTNSGHGY